MAYGDNISRQAALDIFDDYNVAVENGQIEAYSRDRKRLCDLPPAQPELIECDPVKACNEATMNKLFSAYRYLSMLEDLKVYGYVLAKRRTE